MEWPLVGRDELLARLLGELSDPNRRGAVLVGEPGVGKSRLAAELLQAASARGRPTRWAAGTESARSIPFGPFAHLVPAETTVTRSRTEVLREALAAIGGSEGDGRPVILVDDAHLLDGESAALLHLAANTGTAYVIVTVRGGSPAPDAVAGLWKDDVCTRVEVMPLGRPDSQRLVELVLGGPVEQRTHNTLWEASEGNVQYLRELVLAASSTDGFVRDGGMWRLAQPIEPSARLSEIVEARLGRLDRDARRTVELLAIAEPIGMGMLEEICGDQISDLERQRIVRTYRSGRRIEARLDHPIYAEVLRSSMPAARASSVVRAVAEAVAATGRRRNGDLLRLAIWSLEGGIDLDPQLLNEAGRSANSLFDHGLAERISRRSLGLEESLPALLVLAEALVRQKEGSDAESVLQRASDLARTDAERADVALLKADLYHATYRRPEEALAVLRSVAGSIEDRGRITALKARAALISSMLGDIRGVEEMESELPEPSQEQAENLVGAFVASSIAQVMMGRFREAEESIDIGLSLTRDPDNRSLPVELLYMNRSILDLYSGRVEAAATEASSSYERALKNGALDVAGMWAGVQGEILGFQGDALGTMRSFQESVWLLSEHDPFGMMPISYGGLARSHAFMGAADKAREVLDSVDEAAAHGDLRARSQIDRATVWILALEGDIDAAVRLAREAGENAVDAAHPVWGAIVMHLAVRLGRPASVAAPLVRLAGEVEGPLVATMAEHASALAGGSGAGLEEVAYRFGAMGVIALAAEAGSQAADAYERAGDRNERGRRRAALLAARCRGLVTPALRVPTLLTPREHEVCLLAARGLPSRVIGERLRISVRTVDNHLSSVYLKLGVDGRTELATLLRRPAFEDLDRAPLN